MYINSMLHFQPLSPLELVKAARKAHGESVDVGSEVDLWGSHNENDNKAVVSMCVYVVIKPCILQPVLRIYL